MTVPSFRDIEGREWDLRITLGMLPKLREAGLDLTALASDTAGLAGLCDPERFGRVAWVLCGRQAEKLGLPPEAFADGFDGPTLFAAIRAIAEAVADFTQPPAVASAAKDRLPAAWKETEARAVLEMDRRLSDPPTPSGSTASGGSSPASPGSTAAT